MRRFAICWAASMLCPALTFAQITPMFEMPVYFEDAVGNRDTLVVGYDTAASYNALSPLFDGSEITEPFDSIFEIRAIHYDDSKFNGYEMSKRVIGAYETLFDISCGVSEGIKIVVSAKYPPISITYDSTRLTHPDSCRANTILSRDWLIFLLQYWWDAEDWRCMGATSRIMDDLEPQLYQGVESLTIDAEVEGQGVKALPGFFIQFRGWGPCTDSSILHVSAPVDDAGLRIVPNPAEGDGQAMLDQAMPDSGGSLEIWRMDGILARRTAWPPGQQRLQLSASGLPTGLYWVVVKDAKGRQIAAGKWVRY